MTLRSYTILGLYALSGCMSAPGVEQPARAEVDQVISLGAIDTTTGGACFSTTAGPTETVVVTQQIEVAPAVKDQNGVVLTPAIFRNITRPETSTIADGKRFETICPPALTVNFVKTLQRAMITRRAYTGPVSGQYDTATGLSVQRYQRELGIDSPFLAVSTARQLGILAIDRDRP